MFSTQRMRRTIARNRSDRVEYRVNVLDDDVWVQEQNYIAFRNRFIEDMQIKHNTNVHVSIYRDDVLAFHMGQAVFVLVARPARGRVRIVNTTPASGRGTFELT